MKAAGVACSRCLVAKMCGIRFNDFGVKSELVSIWFSVFKQYDFQTTSTTNNMTFKQHKLQIKVPKNGTILVFKRFFFIRQEPRLALVLRTWLSRLASAALMASLQQDGAKKAMGKTWKKTGWFFRTDGISQTHQAIKNMDNMIRFFFFFNCWWVRVIFSS